MADISQDTYDKGRRIRKILFQQKKGHGDWEVNELQDLWLGFVNDIQRLSGGFGPVGDGLQVESTGNPNELSVRSGVMVVDDTILFLDQDTVISGLTTPVGLRTDYVYAIVARSQKDETDFPDIVEPVTGEVWALRFAYDLSFVFSENHPSSPPVVPAGSVAVELARLNRTPNPIISPAEIIDSRPLHARTYHTAVVGSMGRVSDAGGLDVDVEDAEGKVQGVDFAIPASSGITLTDDSTTYIYIESSGPSRVFTTVVPLEIVSLEAVVVTAGGTISSITDKRIFRSQDQHAMRLEDLEAASSGTIAEIVDARGTEPTLDARLDVSLEEDGSLRRIVDASKITALFPREQTVPDMTVYVEPGKASYGDSQLVFAGGSSPTFVAPAGNDRIDLLYLDDTGVLAIESGVEAVAPDPPSHQSKIAIAEVYLTPVTISIVDAIITDVRPFLNLGGSGDATSIFERLKEPLQHGVMGDALISTIPSVVLPHVDAGSSTGSLMGPAFYELDPGEILQSGFTVAHSQAHDPVVQVVVVVITDRIVQPSEIQVDVSRNITGGAVLPPINFETVSNFDTHVFTTPPVGGNDNILNIRITNVGATVFTVQGWGLYFNQVGGVLGLLTEGPGIFVGSTGLEVGNQKPNWSWVHPLSTGSVLFTWDSGTSQLAWDASFQFEYAIEGTYQENTVLVGSSPLTGIADGDYVYADLDRLGGNVSLQRQAGKPVSTKDRVVFARRIGTELHLQDGATLLSGVPAVYPKLGLSLGAYQGLQIANSPGSANAVATMADVGGGSLLSVYSDGQNASSGIPASASWLLFLGGASNVPVPVGAKYAVLQGYIAGPSATAMDLGHFYYYINVTAGTITGYALGHDGTAPSLATLPTSLNATTLTSGLPLTIVPKYGEDALGPHPYALGITTWTGAGGAIGVQYRRGTSVVAISMVATLAFFG